MTLLNPFMSLIEGLCLQKVGGDLPKPRFGRVCRKQALKILIQMPLVFLHHPDEILEAEGIKAEVVPWDLGSFKGQNADLIVAPMDMEQHLRSASAKVVLIKNLVDKTEVKEKVLAAIREFNQGQ